jgi:hypothetical protein
MNVDETELPLDGSKRAGHQSVNNVLFGKSMPRPGQPSTGTPGRNTGLFTVNAAGEVGSTFVIRNTGEMREACRRVQACAPLATGRAAK